MCHSRQKPKFFFSTEKGKICWHIQQTSDIPSCLSFAAEHSLFQKCIYMGFVEKAAITRNLFSPELHIFVFIIQPFPIDDEGDQSCKPIVQIAQNWKLIKDFKTNRLYGFPSFTKKYWWEGLFCNFDVLATNSVLKYESSWIIHIYQIKTVVKWMTLIIEMVQKMQYVVGKFTCTCWILLLILQQKNENLFFFLPQLTLRYI